MRSKVLKSHACPRRVELQTDAEALRRMKRFMIPGDYAFRMLLGAALSCEFSRSGSNFLANPVSRLREKILLSEYGSIESRQPYARLISEYLSSDRASPLTNLRFLNFLLLRRSIALSTTVRKHPVHGAESRLLLARLHSCTPRRPRSSLVPSSLVLSSLVLSSSKQCGGVSSTKKCYAPLGWNSHDSSS